MRSAGLAISILALLAGCNSGSGNSSNETAAAATSTSPTQDQMAAHDPAPGQQPLVDLADAQPRPTMQLQVVLDRLGFTPGVVDGKPGSSTSNAIQGFQDANDIEPTGKLDDATKQALARWDNIPATRVVTVPEDFAAGPFYAIPDHAAEQAKMASLGYTSLDEKLAERFHTTMDTLKALNPGGRPARPGATPASAAPAPEPSASAAAAPSPVASSSGAGFTPQPGPPSLFRAGQRLRVPNVGADEIVAGAIDDSDWLHTLQTLGVGSEQPKADKLVVSKSKGTLKVFDKAGKLVAMYTATMGSTHDPLPLGNWKVKGVAHNPPFEYDPSLFWDVPDSAAKQKLPPGPNGPVGVVWIDLTKEHYGIHGTPEPQTIGRAESHGCVRLTNWDAARLAGMVSPGTKVLFEA